MAPDPAAELHDSRTRFYRLRPAYDRRLADETARTRMAARSRPAPRRRHDEDGTYRPPGLAEWLATNKPITPVQEKSG